MGAHDPILYYISSFLASFYFLYDYLSNIYICIYLHVFQIIQVIKFWAEEKHFFEGRKSFLKVVIFSPDTQAFIHMKHSFVCSFEQIKIKTDKK